MMVLLRYITLLICWSRDYLYTGPMEHAREVAKPKQKQTGARGGCLRVVGYYRFCLCYIHSMARWLVVGAGHISLAYHDQFACLHMQKLTLQLNQHHHLLHHAADHVSMDEWLPTLMTGTTCHKLACPRPLLPHYFYIDFLTGGRGACRYFLVFQVHSFYV